MAKLTLTNVTSGYSTATKVNANNDAVEAALELTLSRNGTAPNEMTAQLDMNNNRIINLPDGVDEGDGVNLGQVTTIFNELVTGVCVGEIPQNIQAGNYTITADDVGEHIFHASGAGAGDTYTIPANATLALDIGSILTFVNRSSSTISIAITTDTMYLMNSTTSGTRTLAENCVATAFKVETTVWLIGGSGLT
jgi:hypothetical protein